MPTANYDVAFSAIRIRETRSRHNDTIWIRMKLFVDGKDRGTINWDGTSCREVNQPRSGRDFNDGYFDMFRNARNTLVGVQTEPITETSIVQVSFLVLNSGATPLEKNVRKLLSDVSAAAGAYENIWGWLVSALANKLSDMFADFDGPVAADSKQFTGAQIRKAIGAHPYYNWVGNNYLGQRTPGRKEVSNYDCTIQFTRHK
jgi:hypothetical protein